MAKKAAPKKGAAKKSPTKKTAAKAPAKKSAAAKAIKKLGGKVKEVVDTLADAVKGGGTDSGGARRKRSRK